LGTSPLILALAARESEVKIYAIFIIQAIVATEPQLGQHQSAELILCSKIRAFSHAKGFLMRFRPISQGNAGTALSEPTNRRLGFDAHFLIFLKEPVRPAC
jgi:hypothetical protein